MTARKPLVRIDGQVRQLPAGDSLDGNGDFLKNGSVQMTGAFDESVPVQWADSMISNGVLNWDQIPANTALSPAQSTQITGMSGARDGARRLLKFNTGDVLFNTSGSFELPGGQNITAALGDSAEFIRRSSTRWQCVWYQRGDGTALVSSGGGTGDFKKDGSVAMTGAFNQAPTVVVASALDTDIVNVASDTIQVNGQSTIQTLGTAPTGIRRLLTFRGATLVNSGSIVLPTSANINTQDGDAAEFVSLGGGNWRCVSYLRKDGTALAAGSTGPSTTDALPEGSTNLYFTEARAKAANTDKVLISSVGSANGVAPLGSDSKIAAAYLPSYVDDVLEYANLAAFPATGETGKIYIALDTNREYRWSGSTYVQLVASPGTTDNVPEGTTNLYFTVARVLAAVLNGFAVATTNSAIVSTDSILVAFGKAQKQVNDLATAVAGKEPTITAGGASTQYWNGLKSFVDFATSVRAAVLTGLSLSTSTPVTAADSVLTAIGKLQAQLTAYGGVFRTETIATTSVNQTSYAVPNGYTVGSIIVFFNGVLQAPADFTATDGVNVVLASGALSTSDIMSIVVIGAVRAQDDALLSYTVAGLPAASANTAKLRYCTNMSGGAGPVFSDGTNWKRVADNSIVTV